MQPTLDSRYAVTRLLRHHRDRLTCEARDTLTGQPVILKTDAQIYVQRELASLLALPEGVGPAVLDVVWTAEKQLVLVLEHLAGSTVQKAARRIPVARVPTLVHAICQSLGHLHRAGFTHCDLKPSNLFILNQNGHASPVRLLDFGFALGRMADPSYEPGGTPPYLAPEVVRGWMIDGRADQFSLGVILTELFPKLTDDAVWPTILNKIKDPLPGRRYPHVLALRDEVAARFGVPRSLDAVPPFGAGPMHGRDLLVDELTRRVQASSPGQILIQSRPGVGLTRFLLEGLLAIALKAGPPTRLIDVAQIERGGCSPGNLRDFVQDRRQAGETILCGLPDPSPKLWWLERSPYGPLRQLLVQPDWERMLLPPLDADSFAEIAIDSLGSGGAPAEELARGLHAQTDGDLRSAAEGFAEAVSSRGSEDGLSWSIKHESISASGTTRSPSQTEPTLDSTPDALARQLRMCARAGQQFPAATGRDLLKHFGDAHGLNRLLEHGYLQPEGELRISFITTRLWTEAAESAPDQDEEVDAYLHTHFCPDPACTDDVLLACHRGRRIGDRSRETGYLASALQRASAERRWPEVQALIAYPEPVPRKWSVELALELARNLADILTPEWSEQRIVLALANAIWEASPEVSATLKEHAAQGTDPGVAVEAVFLLLDLAINDRDADSYARHLGDLRARTMAGGGVDPGILNFCHARQAFALGHREKAAAFADQAVRQLHGSGSFYEPLALQLLAVLRFPRDPEGGISAMRSALESTHDSEQQAQMHSNLAVLYSQSGDIEAAAECADQGVKALQSRVSTVRLARLRSMRAWTWAELDRVEPAIREAHNLLNTATIRQFPSLHISLRGLLSYCLLHRSSGRAAITEAVRAWEEAGQQIVADRSADCLRELIDGLWALEAWGAVREYGSRLESDLRSESDEHMTVLARASALRAQAAGRPNDAANLLSGVKGHAARIGSVLARARYSHHCGIVSLALAAQTGNRAHAKLAREHFRKELSTLKGPGHGYSRGRALLGLGRTHRCLGDHQGAALELDRAVDLARSIRSMGLLAECLQERIKLTRTEHKHDASPTFSQP